VRLVCYLKRNIKFIDTEEVVFNCVPYHNGMGYPLSLDGGGRNQVV